MNRLLGLALAAAVAAADQLSKAWIVSFLADAPAGRGQFEVTGFFSLVLVRNRGMSFGLFNDDSPWNALLFSLLAAVIVAALAVWLWRTESGLSASVVGLVSGGALGNVIDRLRLGAVVDFLDFHWGDWHFPAFNLADSAITVGAALFLIDGLLKGRESRN